MCLDIVVITSTLSFIKSQTNGMQLKKVRRALLTQQLQIEASSCNQIKRAMLFKQKVTKLNILASWIQSLNTCLLSLMKIIYRILAAMISITFILPLIHVYFNYF